MQPYGYTYRTPSRDRELHEQALGVTKRSWTIYAKEMLEIVEAIRLWRPYLLSNKFFVLIDQRSLKFFLKQRVATLKQQKWATKLLGYDYQILYRPGKENLIANTLSRRAESPMIHVIHLATVSIWDEIRVASTNDAYIATMKA